jgi:hypothetical protein
LDRPDFAPAPSAADPAQSGGFRVADDQPATAMDARRLSLGGPIDELCSDLFFGKNILWIRRNHDTPNFIVYSI